MDLTRKKVSLTGNSVQVAQSTISTDKLRVLLKRVKILTSQKLTISDEFIRTSLVLPLFDAFGYDVFDFNEFFVDYNMEDGGKIDYIIFYKNNPMMVINIIKRTVNIKQQIADLAKIFRTVEPFYAILTNGIVYRIYEGILRGRVTDVMGTSMGWQIDLSKMSEDDVIKSMRRCSRADISTLGEYV